MARNLDKGKAAANSKLLDSPFDGEVSHRSMEQVILQFWNALEPLHDRCQIPDKSETCGLEFNTRSLEGFEFNDFIDCQTTFRPRLIKLLKPAADWLKLVQKIGTINLFGSGFGDLIDSGSGCPGKNCKAHGNMPDAQDYLATPMAVLEKIEEKSPQRTGAALNFAEGMYWTDPDQQFEHCQAGASSSLSYPALISRLDKHVGALVQGDKADSREIFRKHKLGAMIFGHHPKKLRKSWTGMSSSAKTKSQPKISWEIVRASDIRIT